jgi:DNA polymerase III subunit delta
LNPKNPNSDDKCTAPFYFIGIFKKREQRKTMLESVSAIIKSRNFPHVLLMFGEEEFLLEEAYTALVGAAVDNDGAGNGMQGFNFDVFDGGEMTSEALTQTASAFPMMAERRVVVVKHFEKMQMVRGGKVSGKASGKDAEKKSPFAAYIANPAPTTFLILLTDYDELNGLKMALGNTKMSEKAKKKLSSLKFPYNRIIEQCEWIEFPKIRESALPSWVAERFKLLGREIAPDACELLVAQSGESLRDLHNEIQKIITFAPDSTMFTRDEIASVIGASKNYNIFELQRAIGGKKLAKSLEITQRMLVAEKQELLIISMLTRYFTILWKLTEAITQTQSEFELGKTLGINSYFVPEYTAALKVYSRVAIEQAFYALCDADVAIKTSSQEGADVILQKMLMRIMK